MKPQAKQSMAASQPPILASSIDDKAFDSLDDDVILRKDASMFNWGLEAVVSPYARIFSSFINAGRKFLLAHNRFVSIFNLTKERWTRKHYQFPDAVRQIFRNRKTRKGEAENGNGDADEAQFDVGVLVGKSTFHFFEFEGLGKVSLLRENISLDGSAILDFAVDQQNDTGFYFTLAEEGRVARFGAPGAQEVALKVLVDKRISDISPEEFLSRHRRFSISMKYRQEAVGEDKDGMFAICLDALDDDEKEL